MQEIDLPGGALIMGVRHEDEVIVPRGDTRLQLDDILMLIAPEEQFDVVHAQLEQA